MKIGTWNMDYWRRVCTDHTSNEYRTKEEIEDYKTGTLRNITQSNFDFLLLQETNSFFYFGKISKRQWPYEFDYSDKKIYYQKFPRLDWGNAIVANKKYKYLKNSNPRSGCNYYYGKFGQMFLDFSDEDGNIITIINIYNKCKNGKLETYYETLENIILEIGNIIQNKNNLIILAGDFNGSVQSTPKYPDGDPRYIDLFGKIEKIGFTNRTENIGGTVSYEDYQNDYIFIKNCKEQKVKPIKHTEDLFSKFSDHYLIECEVEL
jgi:endonuclease/exonuclease/phosphatase family metal-dependent hydrolase